MKPTIDVARAAPQSVAIPRTAALLYWLLIACGLVGLTLQRLDAPSDVGPLWLGTVLGVGLGQTVAWMRVRAWLLGAIAIIAAWV